MPLQDEDLIQEFVVESVEHLADIESQLLAIEAAGANINVDLVNQVFRAIHSIKGAAGFLGLITINRLSHVMENVLNRIRNRDLTPTRENVEVLLKSADALGALLKNVGASNDQDVGEFLAALEKVNQAPSEQATDAQPTSGPAVLTLTAELAAPATTLAIADLAASEGNITPADSPRPDIPAAIAPLEVRPAASSPAVAAPTVATPESSAAATTAEASIRVAVSVVDQLMNLAGELVLSRNQLLQAYSRDDRAALGNATGGLDQVTSELQEAIMRTRMQPVGTVFGRFPRLVRDLSAKLGKQVDLQIEGKEVEVDKTIIEAIGDPLTHLIRNSIDHGVETPEVRTRRGKRAVGTVKLRAYHQAGKVRIDLEDDGGGIDPQKLKKKAVAMGLFSAERAEQMSDRDAIRLIFHPGLSTAAQVTDVSGRGVGMDVVRTNIEKLAGAVDVESTLGSGTIIRITLPLTLAIIPSLVVRCIGERFAIPQINIVELVRVRAGEVGRRINLVKDKLVLRLRDALLPLVRLDEALGRPPLAAATGNGAVNIIVVESGDQRYGLIVDGLHDSEEIVVKPLGRHLKDCRCLAGATILGDGHVALILDIDGIGRAAQLQRHDAASDHSDTDAEMPAIATDRLKVLLFTSDPAERFAVPLALVSRIERIRAEQMDSLGGQEILQYRGSTMPLLGVEGQLRTRPRPTLAKLYVVVFNLGGREVGLVAPNLEDTHDVPAAIDATTLREPGVAGSLVIGNKTVRLLDVYELARVLHPDWFGKPPAASATAPTATPDVPASLEAPLVVLAEDSPFFRKQVTNFLEGEGYRVKSFEDGRKAWDFLTRETHDACLVVTDVEMPVMNGLQLCRHLKDHPQLGRLPVIALTTLAGDEDVQRGFDAGVNEYQIKMDREQLIVAVRRLLDEQLQTANAAAAGRAELMECMA